jgi:hypothetical protein
VNLAGNGMGVFVFLAPDGMGVFVFLAPDGMGVFVFLAPDGMGVAPLPIRAFRCVNVSMTTKASSYAVGG